MALGPFLAHEAGCEIVGSEHGSIVVGGTCEHPNGELDKVRQFDGERKRDVVRIARWCAGPAVFSPLESAHDTGRHATYYTNSRESDVG